MVTVIHEHQKKGAKQLHCLFEYYSEQERIILLNRYSKDYLCSSKQTKFDFKYGDCTIAANNSKPLMQSLTARYTYSVLSTFASVDDDGKVLNDNFFQMVKYIKLWLKR